MSSLVISEGELKEGYWWTILDEKGEAIAAGYHRLEKHAIFYGERALSVHREVSSA